MGTFLLIKFSDILKTGVKLQTKDYFWLFYGLILFFMAFYTIIRYLKNAPKVVVDNRKILINYQAFYWTEVAQIDLTGKRPFKYLFNFPMEGTMLTLKDGTVKGKWSSYSLPSADEIQQSLE